MKHHTSQGTGTGRTLDRYTRRVFLPTLVAGVAAIILFIAITRKEYRAAEPNYEYEAANPTPNEENALQTGAQANTQAVITSLQPQVRLLSEKIEALEEADANSWKNRRDDVVQAWTTFDTTYQALRGTLPDKG